MLGVRETFKDVLQAQRLPAHRRTECREITTDAEFCALEDAWRELFQNCSYPTPFATWEWVYHWWKHFLANDHRLRLLVLAIHDRTGRIIGLAPFYHSTPKEGAPLQYRGLYLLGAQSPFIRRGITEEPIFLLRQGCEQEAMDAIQAQLLTTSSDRRWDYVTLRIPWGEGETASWKPKPLTSLAARLQKYQIIQTHRLYLSLPWEKYRRSLTKSMRDNLAYYPCLLTRHGHDWSVRLVTEPDEVMEAAETLVALHRMRANSPHGPRHVNHFPDPLHCAFLREILPTLAALGMASIYLLEVNGAKVAAQSFLERRDVLTVYYSGFDPNWHTYSPLLILFAEALKGAISRNISRVELLRGLHPAKTRWGTRAEPVYHEIYQVRQHPLSLFRALLYHGSHQLQKWQKQQKLLLTFFGKVR